MAENHAYRNGASWASSWTSMGQTPTVTTYQISKNATSMPHERQRRSPRISMSNLKKQVLTRYAQRELFQASVIAYSKTSVPHHSTKTSNGSLEQPTRCLWGVPCLLWRVHVAYIWYSDLCLRPCHFKVL